MVSSRKFELMGGRNGVPPDDVLLKNATTLGMVGWTGGPVSGKGTQCQRLSQAHGIVHISIGDVLRQEISRPESQYAETIRENMMHCKNRPQGEQLCGVILLGVSTRGKGRLFMDGFPRNKVQSDYFEKTSCPITCLLILECPESVIIERLARSNRNRFDNNLDIIRKRIEIFHQTTAEVIDAFRMSNRAYVINSNQFELDVTLEIEVVLKGLIQ